LTYTKRELDSIFVMIIGVFVIVAVVLGLTCWGVQYIYAKDTDKTMQKVKGYEMMENHMLSDLIGQRVETKVYTTDERYVVELDNGDFILVEADNEKLVSKEHISYRRYKELLKEREDYNRDRGVDLTNLNNEDISTVPLDVVQ